MRARLRTVDMHLNSDSKSKNFFQEFAYGLILPFRAADLIFSHRKLLTFSLIPIFLTILTLVSTIYFGITRLSAWVDQLFSTWIRGDHSVVLRIAIVLISISILYFVIQSAGFVAGFLSSPFNDLLAEKTEHVIGVSNIPKPNFLYSLKVFFLDLRKTTFTLGMILVFSVGLLIPGLNIASFVALSLLNTFTFITYPQSRRAHGLMESWHWIRNHWGAALGFGIIISLLLAAPVIDFFALPIAVVGGTMLYFRK